MSNTAMGVTADTEAPAADVWVFQAAGATLPCGLFRTREKAETWLLLHRLSGLLSGYPLDTGLVVWLRVDRDGH
ncbi:MAG: hypothetical protein V4671_09055, partial [Armatimonadota bacterium]